ncbi:anthocyanidin 3-O-glucoside 2'''-O-xylosyltransferase-like [Silene latifolia]|uniref:anthocyanidin 3-O-glucoside 2'''-O-xylosyltransferase-like n=1 Tax=Silene latifolia TaxID=37657 RepID=UPI003D778B12
MARKELNIVMFPWLAFGHFIPYLHLANKLADKGHKITFLIPNKAKLQLDSQNQHPSLITLLPITVPQVDSLPLGAQTTADIPLNQHGDLSIAMDRTRPDVESILETQNPKPDLILFDMAHWVPAVAAKLNIVSVSYNIVCAISVDLVRDWYNNSDKDTHILPSWTMPADASTTNFGENITILQRSLIALGTADAISIRTCREVEGEYCDRIAARFKKPVLLSGITLPESTDPLDLRWVKWLGKFKKESVIFCCLGSQHVLDKPQIQELALGLEMTGLPFLLAVKPPVGFATLEEVLPEGFVERVKDRGMGYGGWVQQTQILAHPSVGCFVCHCGSSSMWEALVSDTQLVLFPQIPDQALNAELMAGKLKVGVKVERKEDGGVSKEVWSEAVKSVMNEDSEIGSEVKKNHAKWREMLTSEAFADGYIDSFIKDLQDLIGH